MKLCLQARQHIVDGLLLSGRRPLDSLWQQRPLYRFELIANTRGLFEVLRCCCLSHPLPQRVDELVPPAFEKGNRILHVLAILLLRDVVNRGHRKAADLAEQTGPRVMARVVIRTGAKVKGSIDDSERIAKSLGKRIGAEVASTVILDVANDLESGVALTRFDLEINEVAPISLFDVEARRVAEDELVFQEERFLLVIDEDDVDIAEGSIQEPNEDAVIARSLHEIGANACAKIIGFTDVNDMAELVLHQIDARRARQIIDFLPQSLVHPRNVRPGAEDSEQPLSKERPRPLAIVTRSVSTPARLPSGRETA